MNARPTSRMHAVLIVSVLLTGFPLGVFSATDPAPRCSGWLADYHHVEELFIASLSVGPESTIDSQGFAQAASAFVKGPASDAVSSLTSNAALHLSREFGSQTERLRFAFDATPERSVEGLSISEQGKSELARFAKLVKGPAFQYEQVAFSPEICLQTCDGAMVDGVKTLFIDSLSVQLGRPSPGVLHELGHGWVKRRPHFGNDHLFLGALISLDGHPISDITAKLGAYDTYQALDEPAQYALTLHYSLLELERLESQPAHPTTKRVVDRLWTNVEVAGLSGAVNSAQTAKVAASIIAGEGKIEELELDTYESWDRRHRENFEALHVAVKLWDRVDVMLVITDPALIASYKSLEQSRDAPEPSGQIPNRERWDSLFKHRMNDLYRLSITAKESLIEVHDYAHRNPVYSRAHRLVLQRIVSRLMETFNQRDLIVPYERIVPAGRL